MRSIPGEERRWRRRPAASRALRSGLVLVPITVAATVGVVVGVVLPAVDGAARLGWWMIVVGSALLVLVMLDAVARRFLPLAALLQLTLVFPDRAPSRFTVALRGTSRARLEAWARQTTISRFDDEPGERVRQILGLVAALHAHDPMTRGHSERVRALTELVAEEMRLSDDDADKLQWAALLHDIGKVSVPADVLDKPGRLDDDEWDAVRRHPEEGARLAAPLQPWLGEWADAVAHHHERFDGTGYPDGLVGESISLGGRIVSVTDAYDAMTAVSSYRQPKSPVAARAELARAAGTQFDPRVVRAFLNVSLERVRRSSGVGAWLAAVPPLGVLARVGVQVRAALARPAIATKTAAAAGAIVVGAALSQWGGPGTRGGDGSQVALGDTGPNGGTGQRREPPSAVVDRTPVAAAPSADGVPEVTAGGTGDAPGSEGGGGTGAGGAGTSSPSQPSSPSPSPTPSSAPSSPSPAPAPSPSSPSPVLPPVGAQVGPAEIDVLPAPSVGTGGTGPDQLQIGDIIIPLG